MQIFSNKLLVLETLILPLSFIFGLCDYASWKTVINSSDDESHAPIIGFLGIGLGINTLFILLAFNTATESTINAFLWMFYGGAIALTLMQVFYGEDIEPLPFANNPGIGGILIGLFLGLVILAFAIIMTSVFQLDLLPSGYAGFQGAQYNSVLFVPKFFSSVQVGQFSTIDNVAFQIMLTAPGEEMLKASMLYGFYLLAGQVDQLSESAEIFAIVTSTAIWASFHMVLVHFSIGEVILAFVSGLIMFIGWKATGSIFGAIIPHAVYNSVITIISS